MVVKWWFVAAIVCLAGCSKTQKETTPEQMPILVQEELLDAGLASSPEQPANPKKYSFPTINPSCDEYAEKMSACLDRMPAATREAVKEAFVRAILAWSRLEGSAKQALEQGCQTALNTAKVSYAAMGCEF